MKTVKKLISLMLSVLLCMTFFSACGLPKDYVPSPEDMGEWESNYIYYDNYRMKTTGGEYEHLVCDIEVDGFLVKCEESYCTSTYYNGDDVYVCIIFDESENAAKNDAEHAAEYQSCIVKYNLLNKTYKIIYHDKTKKYSSFVIRIFRDDLMVVADGFYRESNYFIIDHEGNILQSAADEYKDYTYIDDYIINKTGDKIEYRRWSDEKFTTLTTNASIANASTWITLKNDVFYIRTTSYHKEPFANSLGWVGRYVVYSLYLYNISSQNLITIFEASAENSMHWINETYFMTYENYVITYKSGTEKGPNDKKWKDSYLTTMEKRKCVLYKINPDLSVSKIYTFDEKIDFTNAQINDGYMNINSFRIDEKNGYRYKQYTLNLQTLKLKKGTHKSKSSPSLDERFVHGNYYYYQSESRNYFYLHRRNLGTNKEEIIQYYPKGSEEETFGYSDFEYENIQAIRNY